MNWFNKIKSMNERELARFLADFDIDDIDKDYCENFCTEKTDSGRCKYDHDCPLEDSYVIEKWLNTKSSEN